MSRRKIEWLHIIRTRMEYAQQLLKDNKKSIAEIYEYIGFANQSALNNTLQKKYNLTPLELQKKLLETSHTYPSYISPYRIVESETIPVLFLSYMTLVAQLLLRHTLGTAYMNMQKKTLYC